MILRKEKDGQSVDMGGYPRIKNAPADTRLLINALKTKIREQK